MNRILKKTEFFICKQLKAKNHQVKLSIKNKVTANDKLSVPCPSSISEFIGRPN